LVDLEGRGDGGKRKESGETRLEWKLENEKLTIFIPRPLGFRHVPRSHSSSMLAYEWR
jgi:hypothetical protein